MHVLRVLFNSIWKLRLEYLRAFYIILKMCFVFCENYMSYDAHFHILSNLIFFVLKRVYYFYSFTQEISDKILKKSICIFWGGIYMDIYWLIKKTFKILKIELNSATLLSIKMLIFLNKSKISWKFSLQRKKDALEINCKKLVYMQNITKCFCIWATDWITNTWQ